MFACTRVVRMAVKTSTGIVGLPVNPNARQDLIALYQKTLEAVKVIPSDAFYRESVESITNYRLSIVESTDSSEAIEEEINCGQIEELIEQAEDELYLIPKFAEWKMWEQPKVEEE